jgi:hypothetical protein
MLPVVSFARKLLRSSNFGLAFYLFSVFFSLGAGVAQR